MLPKFLVLFLFGPGFVDPPVGVSVIKIIKAEGSLAVWVAFLTP